LGPHLWCLHARASRLWLARLAALLLVAFAPRLDLPLCADQSPTEYQVKAAFLFNFLKFVEWPDGPGSDHAKWVIGFVGETPIGEELTALAGEKKVLGRELQVRKFQATDNLRVCNILFISESEKKRVPSILTALRGSSVLTVGDMENFISAGGMVEFLVVDARVRLAIDVGATNRARLRVSSKLLLLAHVVQGTERGVTN
jgi:YfiR/HmsC-like